VNKLQRLECIKSGIETLYEEAKVLIPEIEAEQETLEDVLWKPEIDDNYYYADVDEDEFVNISTWESDCIDLVRLKNGLVFKTKEAAEKHAKRLKVFNLMWQLADQLNDGWMPVYNDLDQDKYIIEVEYGKVATTILSNIRHAQPPFKTKELAERARKLIGDEAIAEAFR